MRAAGPALLSVAIAALTATAAHAWPYTAPRPEAKSVREFDDQGYHVRVSPARQVLAIDAPEEFAQPGPEGEPLEPALSPTLRTDARGFVSASLLAQKAKQFDDGLYAAVELAAESGAGTFPGKAALLGRLAKALGSGLPPDPGNVPGVVFGAARLGGLRVEVPPALAARVDSAVQEFNADDLRSKPLGFYTWSDPLRAVFRQDRMLQTPLEGAAGIGFLVKTLHGDREARDAYERALALASGLTNPLAAPDLRPLLRALDAGQAAAPERGTAFFPPSRAHETDLVMKLYANRPIPDGFDLADALIRRVRSRSIDLRPTPESGWYDYQSWALEPLIVPETTPEAARLRATEGYRKHLVDVFKGVLALTRETHVKQLDIPAPGAALPGPSKPKIWVSPDLSAEPLATYYARRASGYRFVQQVLETAFGAAALKSMHRQTAAGPVATDLAAELDGMIGLFAGASAAVGRELGLAGPVLPPPPGARARSDEADRAAFTRWAKAVKDDPDLTRDARMMVPVFYDLGRRKTKVWVFLGWSQRSARVWYETPPSVEVTRGGRPADPKGFEVGFGNQFLPLDYPVTAEVYVNKILDRDEFRRLCDRHKTRGAILKNLE